MEHQISIKGSIDYWANEFSYTQQDTTFRPSAQDSAEARAFGVDPIFIMNERRAQEVTELKAKQQRIALWKLKQLTEKKVDTTCYICPDTEILPFYTLVTNFESATDHYFKDYKELCDFKYFSRLQRKMEPVFIEKIQEQPNSLKSLKIISRPETQKDQANWFFFPLFALIIMLAILKVFYGRYVNNFFQSSFFLFVASKIHRENSLLGKRIIWMLDVVFFISLPIFSVSALEHFNLLSGADKSNLFIALVIFLGLVLFRLFRFIFIRFVAFFTETVSELDEFYFNQLIYPRILGITLVPMVLLFTYSTGMFSEVILYLTLFVTAIILIIRYIRSFQVFIFKGFSIFYFLLYLCALEIAPILVLAKAIFRE